MGMLSQAAWHITEEATGTSIECERKRHLSRTLSILPEITLSSVLPPKPAVQDLRP